jgi:DNA modification methylase
MTTKTTSKLYLGDCLDVLKRLPDRRVDAVVTDPPWGIDADTDYTRFIISTRSCSLWPNNSWAPIIGDDRPFDPTPWLACPKVAIWGANCFCDRLPIGQWLVWVKKSDNGLGKFMSDAELCWVNRKRTPRRAPGVYVFRHKWSGFDRASERGPTIHPTQKPIAVMRWTIQRLGLHAGSTILDPYMGSGTTGVAAAIEGMNFIGIEIDPTYFAIAKRRIAEAWQAARKAVSA